MAVPCVKTRSDVTKTNAITIGKSQNFLRALRNSQNSLTNSSMEASHQSKLMCHVRSWSGTADNAIGLSVSVEFPVHRVMAGHCQKYS